MERGIDKNPPCQLILVLPLYVQQVQARNAQHRLKVVVHGLVAVRPSPRIAERNRVERVLGQLRAGRPINGRNDVAVMRLMHRAPDRQFLGRAGNVVKPCYPTQAFT